MRTYCPQAGHCVQPGHCQQELHLSKTLYRYGWKSLGSNLEKVEPKGASEAALPYPGPGSAPVWPGSSPSLIWLCRISSD